MRHIKIKHPEWLSHSTPGKSIEMFNRGLYPDSIAGWMLVVSLKHPLRAIYGSNFRAALALLWWSIWEPFNFHVIERVRYRGLIKEWESEWDAEDAVRDGREAARQGKN